MNNSTKINSESRLRDYWISCRALFVLSLLFLVFYGINYRTLMMGDSRAHLYVAASLAREGNYELSEFRAELENENVDLPYYVTETPSGGVRSIFNFLPGTLLAPFVFLFGRQDAGLAEIGLLGKLAASLFTYLGGIFLWFLCRRRAGELLSALLVFAFWFATPLWATSVDYLQHQPLMLFKAIALYYVFKSLDDEPGARETALTAAAVACAFLSRYQTGIGLLFIAAFYLYQLRKTPRLQGLFVGVALVFMLIFCAYNKLLNGSFFDTGIELSPWLQFHFPNAARSVGIFLNPSKGILIHSPWLALMFYWLWRFRKIRLVHAALLLSVVSSYLLYASFTGWFGGWGWGYRYMIDCLPEMTLLSFLAVSSINRRWVKPGWAVLIVIGFGVQAIGALGFDHSWHSIHDLGTMPDQNWLWQIPNNQISYYAKRGRVYIGDRPHQLGKNRYAAAGLHDVEQWGDNRVRWIAEEARFLYVARTDSPVLQVFSPDGGPERVELSIDGGPPRIVELNQNRWLMIPLKVRYQNSVIISLRPNRTVPVTENDDRIRSVALNAWEVFEVR